MQCHSTRKNRSSKFATPDMLPEGQKEDFFLKQERKRLSEVNSTNKYQVRNSKIT